MSSVSARPLSSGLGSITPGSYFFRNPDKGFGERSLRNGLVTYLSVAAVRIPDAPEGIMGCGKATLMQGCRTARSPAWRTGRNLPHPAHRVLLRSGHRTVMGHGPKAIAKARSPTLAETCATRSVVRTSHPESLLSRNEGFSLPMRRVGAGRGVSVPRCTPASAGERPPALPRAHSDSGPCGHSTPDIATELRSGSTRPESRPPVDSRLAGIGQATAHPGRATAGLPQLR